MKKTEFPILYTSRLQLRPIAMDKDVDLLYDIRSNPSVGKFLGRPLATSVQDAIDHIHKLQKLYSAESCIFWVICYRDDPTFLGSITLWNFSTDKKEADIGYELLPSQQGKGLVTESTQAIIDFAKRHPTLERILAQTVFQNEKSIRVLEKFQFVKQESNDEKIVSYCLNL